MNKIAIFYHVYQHGDYWRELFEHQIIRLQKSQLYDAADYIHIGINGSWRMPFDLIKVNVVKRNKIVDSEAETLLDLHNFCKQNPDWKVFYFHTKGVRTYKLPVGTIDDNKWREYLEEVNIDSWQDYVKHLDSYDCAGTEWHDYASLQDKTLKYPHYSGNFWWANASYISKLDPNFLKQDLEIKRYLPEFWIGTGNPNKYNLYSCPTVDAYLRRFEVN